MRAFIPNNINLDTIRKPDKLYYILSLISNRRVFDKRINQDSFVTLSSKILNLLIGGHYLKYLKWFQSEGILECDNHYIPGEKSKGYRFTEEYRFQKVKEIQIKDIELIRRIEMFRKEQELRITETHHKYLFNCLNKISFDIEEARNFINSNISDEDRYNSYMMSADMIESRSYFFVVDEVAGRVHNNITNLSRDLRQFLSYKGQQLVEIDIANSQPFFLNLLVQEYYKIYKQPCISEMYSLVGGNIYIPYVSKNLDIGYGDYDVQLYLGLTSSGTFYEYLMEELDITEERSAFKVRFYSKIFFGRESYFYISEEERQFQRLFPTISRIVSYYKREDYRNLARLLQKAEADIMINSVVPRLQELGIFLLTIHDSVLTTIDNASTVKEIILDEFKKKNLQPTIKIKKGA